LRYRFGFNNQIAAKTGTTNDHSDGWFIGVVPHLVTGMWVGGEERTIRFKGILHGQGASLALPMWAYYMKDVYADSAKLGYMKHTFFDRPAGVPYWKIDCKDYENKQLEEGSGATEEIESELY